MAEKRGKVNKQATIAPVGAKFKEGDKVRVISNAFKTLKSYVGKHGKVTGGVTEFSCRVKLAYDEEVWFDFRELEKAE